MNCKKIIEYIKQHVLSLSLYGPFYQINILGRKIRVINPKFKVSYFQSRTNAGDLFNKDLINYFNIDCIYIKDPKFANLVCLGSVLDNLCSEGKNFPKRLKSKCYVWGAGFTFSDENRVFIRDLEFLAIRGI